MQEIKINDVIRECNGKLIIGNEDLLCENFSKDTRTISRGDIYVGIKGENFDGNLLYKEAFEKGASACIVQGVKITEDELKKYADKTIVLVEDTIDALGKLARYKRSLYDIPVIAVTGSVGKTSTKDIIASVLSEKYKVLKTEGNMNNHIGMPLTILKLKDHEVLVTEMGMNHFGEIRALTNIANPTIAVITNIGTSHIGNLGSRENILKAKLEILEGLSNKGTIIINNDNDLLHAWNIEDKVYTKITYGIDEKSNYNPLEIEIEETESNYKIVVNEEKFNIKVPIGGKHFVYNSLCAIAVGMQTGMKMQEISKGIEKVELTKNRMNIEKIRNNITLINDTYNASYDSMKAVLEYTKEISGNRKIAILGNMLELGEYSKKLHEDVGIEVKKNNIDILITVGDLAKNIGIAAAQVGMKKENIYILDNNQEAKDLIKEIVQPKDILVFKASNAMKFIEIIDYCKTI